MDRVFDIITTRREISTLVLRYEAVLWLTINPMDDISMNSNLFSTSTIGHQDERLEWTANRMRNEYELYFPMYISPIVNINSFGYFQSFRFSTVAYHCGSVELQGRGHAHGYVICFGPMDATSTTANTRGR